MSLSKKWCKITVKNRISSYAKENAQGHKKKEKREMQLYQFERIYGQMEKEFGKIRKGQEEDHAMILFCLEGNALRTHRKYPASNSRRLREAIALALFDIKARYTGEQISLDNFRNEDNSRLEQALLMAFDPFTNEEVKAVIAEHAKGDLEDSDFLHDYYSEPVICLLRIKDSIDSWEKRMGANGYFDFVESYMGAQITGNEMKFTVAMGL